MNRDIIIKYQDEADVFKALGHPTRLHIVHTLENNKRSVKDLTGEVGIDISTMSKHLDVLKRHKIITGEKVKNQVFYTLNIPCVLDAMSCAHKVLNRKFTR